MNRVTGPMAVMAGLVLAIPGIFALFHAASAGLGSMPSWLFRELIISSLSGGALMFWGATLIRQRHLQLHELQHVRVRSRR